MKKAQRQSVQSQAQFLPKQFYLNNILDKSSKQCAQELNTLRTFLFQEFSLKQGEDKSIKQTINQLYIYRLSNQKIALLCIALCFCGTNYLNYLIQNSKKNANINIIRKIIKQFSYSNICNPISDIKNNLPDMLIRLQMFKSEIFDNLDTATARQHFYNYLIKKQGRNQHQEQICQNMAKSIQKLNINFVYKNEMDNAFKKGMLSKSTPKLRQYNYLYLCPITLNETYNYWIICVQSSKPSKQAEFMRRQDFMTKPRLLIVEACEQGQQQQQIKLYTIQKVQPEKQQQRKQQKQSQIEIEAIKQKDKKQNNSTQQIIALLMLIISIIFCFYDKDCQQLLKQLFKFK